jgi:hypothetical protein
LKNRESGTRKKKKGNGNEEKEKRKDGKMISTPF